MTDVVTREPCLDAFPVALHEATEKGVSRARHPPSPSPIQAARDVAFSLSGLRRIQTARAQLQRPTRQAMQMLRFETGQLPEPAATDQNHALQAMARTASTAAQCRERMSRRRRLSLGSLLYCITRNGPLVILSIAGVTEQASPLVARQSLIAER